MSSYILTDQKIPESQKTIEWHKEHIRSFVLYDVGRTYSERRRRQLECWRAYSCQQSEEHNSGQKAITKPYTYSLGMEWIDYPLIESKLEQMVGEFMTRGIKRKTYVINKKAQTAKLNEMFDMLAEDILRGANEEVSEQLGFTPETASPEKELPPNIEEFFEQGFKTNSEQTSDVILNQVLLAKKNMDKIKDLYLDFLLYDECIAYIDEKDGSPNIRKLNIFETELDFNPDSEVQDDPQYLIFNKVLGYNEIINTYDLTKDEIVQLRSYMQINLNSSIHGLEDALEPGGMDLKYSNWISGDRNDLRVRCVEMVWISQKEIRVKVSINKKTGKEIYIKIPDDYKSRKNDDIKSIWVQEKRHCLMCGPDLVLEWGVDGERASRIDNPKKDSIFVTAIRRNNNLSSMQMRSAAYKLIQLQDFASECLFELRLAMRRNNGRVLVYDAAQIPKQFLKDGGYTSAINRVMHHAKKDQFLLINSADKQSRYNFNQFTSLDLTSKGMMEDIINVLALVEQLAGKFLGLSPQREGNIDQYESATGTERAVSQSTARTEVYVKPFETFIKYLFDKILMKGKHVYEEGEITPLIFGDLKTKFFKIYPEYFQEDVGVYIGDNFAEQKKKAVVDQAAQQALSNANTPDLILNLIEVLNADTAGESEAIFKRGVKALNALKAQEAQAQADAQKSAQEATAKIEKNKAELKREEFQNNIDVANITQNGTTLREMNKNTSAEKITLAELENKLLLDERKNTQTSK